jgi:hypothetical protein
MLFNVRQIRMRVRIHVQRGAAFLARGNTLDDINLALAEFSCGAQFAFGSPSDRFTSCLLWIRSSTYIAQETTWEPAATAYEAQ